MNPILEDKDAPQRSGASADATGQGGTKDLTAGKADGPAGQSGVWVEGEAQNATNADQASFDKPLTNPTPSGPT